MTTTIAQLKKAKATWEFTAPPFANGVELVVELREPSITAMLYDGNITNPLLEDVTKLTEKGKNKKPTTQQQASAFRFISSVVEYCLVAPTYKEIAEYAGGLSDSQLLAIYQEVMRSTTDLSSFRTDTTDT